MLQLPSPATSAPPRVRIPAPVCVCACACAHTHGMRVACARRLSYLCAPLDNSTHRTRGRAAAALDRRCALLARALGWPRAPGAKAAPGCRAQRHRQSHWRPAQAHAEPSLQSYPTFGATTRTRTRTELLRIGTPIGGEMPAMAAQPRATRACGRIPRAGRRTRARTAAREGAGGDGGGAQQPPPGFRSRWCDVLRDVRLIVCGAYGVAGAAHVADLLGPQLALRVNGAPSLDELSALGRAGAVRARLPLQCCAARCPLSPKR